MCREPGTVFEGHAAEGVRSTVLCDRGRRVDEGDRLEGVSGLDFLNEKGLAFEGFKRDGLPPLSLK